MQCLPPSPDLCNCCTPCPGSPSAPSPLAAFLFSLPDQVQASLPWEAFPNASKIGNSRFCDHPVIKALIILPLLNIVFHSQPRALCRQRDWPVVCTLHSVWGLAQSTSQRPVNPCSSPFAYIVRLFHCQVAVGEGGAILGSLPDLWEVKSFFLVDLCYYFYFLPDTFFFRTTPSLLTSGAITHKAFLSIPQRWARDSTRQLEWPNPISVVIGSWVDGQGPR